LQLVPITGSESHCEISRIFYCVRIYAKDRERFDVLSSNSTTRNFDLMIRNVTFSDAGIYRCIENLERKNLRAKFFSGLSSEVTGL